MTTDTMPIRTALEIDIMPFMRTSDWSITEKLSVIEFGENRRTINGDLDFNVLPGFQKYKIDYSCSGVRQPPIFDGIYKGQLLTVTPIKELTAKIVAGATSVAVNKTPAAGSFIVCDDLTGEPLNLGTDYTVAGNVVTLAAARTSLTTVRYRFTAQFRIDSLSSNWDEPICTASWDFSILEV
jgi:hypothetical protein